MKKTKIKKTRVSKSVEYAYFFNGLKRCWAEVESEFYFHPTRKWRSDFALPLQKILIEVEGGVWSGGRHTRGSGFVGDMEKYNAAAVLGYRLIRFTPKQVTDDIQNCIKLILDAVNQR